MPPPPEQETDRYERALRGRASHGWLYRVVPVVIVAIAVLGWSGYRVYARLSVPARADDVRVVVQDDAALFEGKRYAQEQADELARAIASAHAGANVTLCAPRGSRWIGLLTYQSFHTKPSFRVGNVEPSHALCAP